MPEDIEQLRKDAERWRKVIRLAFKVPAGRCIIPAPFGASKEEVESRLNEMMDTANI